MATQKITQADTDELATQVETLLVGIFEDDVAECDGGPSVHAKVDAGVIKA